MKTERRLNQSANGVGTESTNLEGFGITIDDLPGSKLEDTNNAVNADEEAKRLTNEKAVADKIAADAKTKADADAAAKALESSEGAKAVEVDGKNYKLNEKGDAINEDGTTFKTKAELDKLEAQANEDDKPLTQEFQEKTGYKILDENGKPKVFEETVDGMIDLTKETAKLISRQELQGLFDADPELKKFYEHRRRGGDVETFVQQRSNAWSKVKLDENNEDMLKGAVVAKLTKAGISKEQAELTANMYKDTNKLKDFGKQAYTDLVTDERNFEINEQKKFEAESKKEEEENTAYWESVKGIVTKGTINNIVIPEGDKEDFFKYMAIPVTKDGLSQEMIDKLTVEQLLQLKYLKFKKFDLGNLVAAVAGTERVKSLRSRLPKPGGLESGEGINKEGVTKPAGEFNYSLEEVISGKSKK